MIVSDNTNAIGFHSGVVVGSVRQISPNRFQRRHHIHHTTALIESIRNAIES